MAKHYLIQTMHFTFQLELMFLYCYGKLLMLVLSLMPHIFYEQCFHFFFVFVGGLFTAVGLNWFTNDKCWRDSFKFSILQRNK